MTTKTKIAPLKERMNCMILLNEQHFKKTTMINLHKTEQGNLLIELTDRQEFTDKFGEENPQPDIHELLDDSRYLDNGWSSGEGKFALTDAPIILEEEETDDDGNHIGAEGVYFFGRYMIENPFLRLLVDGKVIFHKA